MSEICKVTLVLDLPPDLEARLTDEAARLNLPLAEYALRLLGTRAYDHAGRPTTGAELVPYWQREGVIGSRPEIADSQAHARALRRQAEKRAGSAQPCTRST